MDSLTRSAHWVLAAAFALAMQGAQAQQQAAEPKAATKGKPPHVSQPEARYQAGSSPLAKLGGRRLEISGPFPPGDTLVQAGYTLPFGDETLTVEQPLPVALRHVAVVAEKVGEMRLSSPQVRDQQDMPANGKIYIAGRGPAVDANQTLTLTFSGLPNHSTWPRDIALGLAFLILAGGAWSTFRSGNKAAGSGEDRRRQLESRRDGLFDELADLEERHRQGLVNPEEFAARRRELVAALEQVYAALDDDVAVRHAS